MRSLCKKVAVFHGPRVSLTPHFEEDRYLLHEAQFDGATRAIDLLVSALHLPAPLGVGLSDTEAEAQLVAQTLRRWMERVGHSRIIVAGDFNLDPWSLALHQSFNAVMTRRTAEKRFRRHHGRDYPTLYNPMWGCFGDATPGPPGSYRYSDGQEWHIIDQILIGPDLLPNLPPDGVRILNSDGVASLVRTGPSPSDHLPVLLTLKGMNN